MNIPSPPTDNLYKFIAISGLIGLLANLFLSTYYISNRNKQYIELEVTRQKLSYDNIIATYELETLSRDPIHNSNKLLLKKADIHSKTMNLWRINSLKKSIDADDKILFWSGEFFLAISLTAMIYGFIMWKYKLQVYQDLIIKREAEGPPN